MRERKVLELHTKRFYLPTGADSLLNFLQIIQVTACFSLITRYLTIFDLFLIVVGLILLREL